MTARSIYWHDGMFMWPHHMQLEERFHGQKIHVGQKWNVHYDWGLRRIAWDEADLKNHRLVVSSLEARMRDGTLVKTPDDGALPAIDLKDAFAGRDHLTVFLALPQWNPHQPNIPTVGEVTPDGTKPRDTRYLVEEQPLEDENTGDEPQSIGVRRLNLKWMTEADDPAGYDLLPVLRLMRPPGADAPPALDRTYIPPLLACDGWRVLQDDILQLLYHRLGSRADSLAQQALTRNITFDTRNPGDNEILGQLAVLNEGYALLNTLAFAEGVHPLPAYTELCRLVGQLAIYQPARKAPELPRYDHDDLGGCFYRVMQHLEGHDLTRASYEERPFIGEGLRIQVGLEASWLEEVWQMFVGVQSSLSQEEVIRLFTRAGQLDMKIGSSQRVDVIFERGMTGLEFMHAPRPPRLLPSSPTLTYFQVNRNSQKEEWEHVKKSLTLAIRLNRTRVATNAQGTIQGLRDLTIKLVPQGTTTMQFSLFLVPKEAAAG